MPLPRYSRHLDHYNKNSSFYNRFRIKKTSGKQNECSARTECPAKMTQFRIEHLQEWSLVYWKLKEAANTAAKRNCVLSPVTLSLPEKAFYWLCPTWPSGFRVESKKNRHFPGSWELFSIINRVQNSEAQWEKRIPDTICNVRDSISLPWRISKVTFWASTKPVQHLIITPFNQRLFCSAA